MLAQSAIPRPWAMPAHTHTHPLPCSPLPPRRHPNPLNPKTHAPPPPQEAGTIYPQRGQRPTQHRLRDRSLQANSNMMGRLGAGVCVCAAHLLHVLILLHALSICCTTRTVPTIDLLVLHAVHLYMYYLCHMHYMYVTLSPLHVTHSAWLCHTFYSACVTLLHLRPTSHTLNSKH